MSESHFFERPVLNSPYAVPTRHWELDATGQPTQRILESRRPADFITPIPKPKGQKGALKQESLLFDEGLSTQDQQYHSAIITGVRAEVDKWRAIPDPRRWTVTPDTARLLQHWHSHQFSVVRPFFCQIEAVQTAIQLTEVAPEIGKSRFLEHLDSANEEANPGLARLYEDRKKVRVAGTFTVESLSPDRVLAVDENDELVDAAAEPETEYGCFADWYATD